MANIPITDNTTLLNALKTKAQNLPNRGTGSGGGSGSTDLSFVTATASDILEGKTGADSSGNAVNGSMTNNGAWSTTKTSNGDVPIPAGFHNGSGKVSVNVSASAGALDTPSISFNKTLGKFTATSKVKTSGYISTSDTTTANYTISNIYMGGEYTPTKASQTIPLTEKYCTGDVVIKGDNNLVPANIKNGISIFGVQGTYTEGTLDKQYRTASVTPTFESTSNGDMCVVVDNGVCAITPAYLLLYADPENWTTINSWSGDFIIAAYHDVAGGVTSVLYEGSNGFQKVQYAISQGADRGYYERSGGYVSWGFRNDGYSTAGGNAKYKLIYMS